MNKYIFDEEEIPYGILGQFGLTPEMIEDLPARAYIDILQGRCSPLLPITMKDDGGNTVDARTRFKLTRLDDDVDVLFLPRLNRCELGSYSEDEQESLRSGKVIVSHAPDDGSVKCFVQVDPGTNQVLYIPTPVIIRNLMGVIDAFHLCTDDIRMVQDGEPVSFRCADEIMTCGIDLTEKTGIRMIVADRAQWLSERGTDRFDSYNFGIYGCWMKDGKGNLGYVSEEDYTDEMWAEQEKAIARNIGMKR